MNRADLLNVKQYPGIYCITNGVNNKKYIGQSINLRSRLRQHIKNAEINKDYYLYRAMNKYGIDNFSFVILEELEQSEDIQKRLNDLETLYIKKFDTFGSNGYNLTAGGSGTIGHVVSEEARNKISLSNKRYAQTDAYKETHRTETFIYNIADKYYLHTKSRKEAVILLQKEGLTLSESRISRVALGHQQHIGNFIFANSQEDLELKISNFYKNDNLKHSYLNAPDYDDFYQWLCNNCDENGIIPKISEIAKTYNKAESTIATWMKHISDKLELIKSINRNRIIEFPTNNDYSKYIKNKYVIIDTSINSEKIVTSAEGAALFNITEKSFRQIPTNKLYKKRYIIQKCQRLF